MALLNRDCEGAFYLMALLNRDCEGARTGENDFRRQLKLARRPAASRIVADRGGNHAEVALRQIRVGRLQTGRG